MPHTRKTVAPSDVAANAAWEEIMRLATANCLVLQAAGGLATLATPKAQREAGVREQVLTMCVAQETSEILP